MLCNDSMYIAPMPPMRNSLPGEGSLSPDPDEQLNFSEPLPIDQMATNPCYDRSALIAGAARFTTEEPLYETADAVHRDEE